ncbi:hypothetical protein [Falsiroseomonas sp. E2-1-a4]|uniref:hypothetical protein n=1 Tax=Falsiroseomonas sp. E2-1-a4 TaxID=3239299 RepID=UPI003F3E4764
MAAAEKARQTIPLWSLRAALPAEPAPPLARSATVIPLPRGAARRRQVLTYPAAIAVPPRCTEDAAAPERPLAALPLLALSAPTALLGAGMMLFHILG